MDLAGRDMRHLRGRTPHAPVPQPAGTGQALGVTWRGIAASLRIGLTDGGLRTLPLAEHLNLVVDADRRCIGSSDGDTWRPCPTRADPGPYDQCATCSPLSDRACLFDPRCSDCRLPLCRSAHHVYLAFYGPLPKIGMTLAARGDARLIEQGADAYAWIARTPDRFAARRVEDHFSRALRIPQARSARETLPLLARPVPREAIRRRYDALADPLGADPYATLGPLVSIPRPPGLPLSAPPVPAGIEGHHHGRLVAVKGRHALYEGQAGEPVWALDLHAVIGRSVRFDPERTQRP